MYKCNECGGSFYGAHYCVGKDQGTAIYRWKLRGDCPRYRVCRNCAESYPDGTQHQCPMRTPQHVEKTVDRPLKEMLQELIDLMKQRPLYIQVPYQPIDLTITG